MYQPGYSDKALNGTKVRGKSENLYRDNKERRNHQMRKTIKTMLRMLIVLVLLSSMPALPACASAAKVRCYTISSGKTTVYGNSSLTRKCGTVTGSQEIKVLSVSRKYCKISYTGPDKKTKTGYISTRAILCGTGGESCKIKEKLKAYQRIHPQRHKDQNPWHQWKIYAGPLLKVRQYEVCVCENRQPQIRQEIISKSAPAGGNSIFSPAGSARRRIGRTRISGTPFCAHSRG